MKQKPPRPKVDKTPGLRGPRQDVEESSASALNCGRSIGTKRLNCTGRGVRATRNSPLKGTAPIFTLNDFTPSRKAAMVHGTGFHYVNDGFNSDGAKNASSSRSAILLCHWTFFSLAPFNLTSPRSK